MSSSRTLFAVMCLLLLAMPVTAQEIGGKTFEQWKSDLVHSDSRVRVKAILALKVSEINAGDVPRVVKALGERVSHDSKAVIRYEAAKALIRFGADARDAQADLAQGLGDTTSEIRLPCILALVATGVDETKGPDARVTDALILRAKASNEPSGYMRREAIRALGVMGPPHDANKRRQVIGVLREYHQDPNKGIRIWACAATMILEKKVNEKNLKSIEDYLQDGDRNVRVEAIRALESLLERTRRFVPAIARLLRSEKDSQVIEVACHALGRLSDRNKQVLETLVKLTRFDEAEFIPIVRSACDTLAEIAADNGEVAESLVKVLKRKDLDEQDKDAVRKVLARVGAIHAVVANTLNNVLKDKDLDEQSKNAIRKALDGMGKSGDERSKDSRNRAITP
ncbi:MAG TPA: HEAT repeat domain-containing protein [Gemmataceae bacterium]